MATKTQTWGRWLEDCGAADLITLPNALSRSKWDPAQEDREAAWLLYTELRTRIATQPLHYLSGDEETALDSLFKLFGFTRETIESHGPAARHFATIAVHVLNRHVRPLTARWHKKKLEGRLLNDDERRIFRSELITVREKLVVLCGVLGRLALGDDYKDDGSCGESGPSGSTVADLGEAIPFTGLLFDPSVAGHEEVYRAELAAIRARRDQEDDIANLVGLACSGGGIRSATFCLGVAQSLARHGMLSSVDYLSTVSGGGYFGAFLSSYLNSEDQTNVGLGRNELPFSETARAEPAPVRELRNNSKYLLKGGLLGQARMAGLALLGILVNLLTLAPVLAVALTLTVIIQRLGVDESGFRGLTGMLLGVISLLLAILLLGLPLVYQRWQSAPKRIAAYERVGIIAAIALIGIWVLGWVLPRIYGVLIGLLDAPLAVLCVVALLPIACAIAAYALGTQKIAGRILLVLAGVGGPLLLAMTYFVLLEILGTSVLEIAALILVTLVLLVWLSFIDMNSVSLHRYYRNRLAETYLLGRGKNSAVINVDPQPLSQMRSNNPQAPYHLINAAVNLPSSSQPELRGRNTDFFIFSRDYCGSPLLGYCPTTDCERSDPHLDLGTAMAVSGAAASAHMGTLTVKSAVFWLTLLNVRLSYWLPNPKHIAARPAQEKVQPFSLWRELFGQFDENGKFVNLSDGGHIENLGIYELLRRQCKFVIAIDAEADPDLSFSGLMQLIRYARIDFGIDIDIDLSLLTKTTEGYSRAHFAVGRIGYPGSKIGHLLYIKSSLTGNERDYVMDYRRRNPGFPHETTADQFFDESQFEAYRALGEHIGDDLFREELNTEDPSSLSDWFAGLVGSLREKRMTNAAGPAGVQTKQR